MLRIVVFRDSGCGQVIGRMGILSPVLVTRGCRHVMSSVREPGGSQWVGGSPASVNREVPVFFTHPARSADNPLAGLVALLLLARGGGDPQQVRQSGVGVPRWEPIRTGGGAALGLHRSTITSTHNRLGGVTGQTIATTENTSARKAMS